MILDAPAELVFPGVACVGTVTHATLPLQSRSTTTVSVIVRIDSVMIDGDVVSADDRSFLVTQQSFLFDVSSSRNIQVSLSFYLITRVMHIFQCILFERLKVKLFTVKTLLIFIPGRRVPKSYSCCFCWNQFSADQKSLRLC